MNKNKLEKFLFLISFFLVTSSSYSVDVKTMEKIVELQKKSQSDSSKNGNGKVDISSLKNIEGFSELPKEEQQQILKMLDKGSKYIKERKELLDGIE